MSDPRVQAIRKLCRLGGVRPDADDAELRARFGEHIDTLVPAGRDAAWVIREALDYLPPIRGAEAIRNALEGEGALGDKRPVFMAEHDVSLSTMIRAEEEGAELLVSYIDKALQRAADLDAVAEFDRARDDNLWTLAQREADERGIPVEKVLFERLRKLERAVEVLERSSKPQSGFLSEMVRRAARTDD